PKSRLSPAADASRLRGGRFVIGRGDWPLGYAAVVSRRACRSGRWQVGRHGVRTRPCPGVGMEEHHESEFMFHRSLLLFPLLIVTAALARTDAPSPLPKDTLPELLAVDDIPLGLDARPAATDNPLTAARVALGRRLFFDPILSADGTVACASCHRP